jgi:uncharacterized membrane protein
MPVVIASKSRFYGTVTPPALNTETTVIEISGQADDYIVEGYLDLSNLATNDALEVREYIAVDGANYRILYRYSFSGLQGEPILRLHAKTLLYNMRYKVTVVQTAGSTLKSIPYGFIVEVMGVA